MEIAIEKLIDVGARVASVVCDCPQVQLSMMRKLGANLDVDSINTVICANIKSSPIHIIHDMCHCIKNVRNSWAYHKVLKNSEGKLIEWAYIEKLVNLQSIEELHSANKLTHRHVNFKNQIMKVKLATQVLSRSVGKSLRFCRDILKLPEFAGSEATEEFCYIMNDIFDLLNSRFPTGTHMKAPLTVDNEHIWNEVFEKTKKYILGLKTSLDTNICKSDSRKTAFVGIICNIEAVKCIFFESVAKGHMSSLLTHKLSQDHLEHFFGLVRARFGANNNPTPLQFKHTYRRLLLGVTNNIVHNANVLAQDSCEIVALIPSVEDKIDYVYNKYDLDDNDLDNVLSSTLSEYSLNVIEYISGFVVRQVSCKLSCRECTESLNTGQSVNNSLTKIRDFGNLLMYPSDFVKKISEISEKILKVELSGNSWLSKKYFFDFIVMKICNSFVSFHGDILKTMDNHCYELTKKIVSCYVTIRLKYHAKSYNDKHKKTRLRSKLSKIILHNNQ